MRGFTVKARLVYFCFDDNAYCLLRNKSLHLKLVTFLLSARQTAANLSIIQTCIPVSE